MNHRSFIMVFEILLHNKEPYLVIFPCEYFHILSKSAITHIIALRCPSQASKDSV